MVDPIEFYSQKKYFELFRHKILMAVYGITVHVMNIFFSLIMCKHTISSYQHNESIHFTLPFLLLHPSFLPHLDLSFPFSPPLSLFVQLLCKQPQ